jgi:hypothetical protein
MRGMAKPPLLEVLQSGLQFDLNLPVRGRVPAEVLRFVNGR